MSGKINRRITPYPKPKRGKINYIGDLIFDLRTFPASLSSFERRPEAAQAELRRDQYVDAPFENLKVSVKLP